MTNQKIDGLAKRLHENTIAMADRKITYHNKESSIAGTLCLSRNRVEQLFSAAIANTTTTNLGKACCTPGKLTIYYALQDIPMAQSELKKSLAILPNIASNLLKLSQLAFLQGEKEDARKILGRLRGMSLLQSERDTIAILMIVLNQMEL